MPKKLFKRQRKGDLTNILHEGHELRERLFLVDRRGVIRYGERT